MQRASVTLQLCDEVVVVHSLLCEHQSGFLLYDGVVVGRRDWEAIEWQNLELQGEGFSFSLDRFFEAFR